MTKNNFNINDENNKIIASKAIEGSQLARKIASMENLPDNLIQAAQANAIGAIVSTELSHAKS